MTRQYYMREIDKIMDDPQYSAQLTVYMLDAVKRMAKSDVMIDPDDFDVIVTEIHNRECDLVNANDNTHMPGLQHE